MSDPPEVGKVIPFYGSQRPGLFEIERRCMDREGPLLSFLDRSLPSGRILDIGAGNGFTAFRLRNAGRNTVPLEPDPGMIERGNTLQWVRGVAQEMPFSDDTFSAAYATFAYFFPCYHGFGDEGLVEASRVVSSGGLILIADTAGDDEMCSMFKRHVAGDPEWWAARDFERKLVASHFKFDNLEEAAELMNFYWEVNGRTEAAKVKLEIEMKVAVYTKVVS